MDDLSIYIIVWVVCGIACFLIAQARKTEPIPWFVAGALLGPFGVIAALLAARPKA